MNDRTRQALVRELDALKRAIRRHPATWGRVQDMSLREYIAAIRRRDEIEDMLTRNPERER